MAFQEKLKEAMIKRLGLPEDHFFLCTAKPIDEAFLGTKNTANADEIVQEIIPVELQNMSKEALGIYFNRFDYDLFKEELMIEVNRLNSQL